MQAALQVADELPPKISAAKIKPARNFQQKKFARRQKNLLEVQGGAAQICRKYCYKAIFAKKRLKIDIWQVI